MTACLAVSGCTTSAPPGADALAEALATGLETGSLTAVSFADPAAAQSDYRVVTEGIGELRPQVTVAQIDYSDDKQTATFSLTQSYDFGERDWTFTSRATAVHQEAGWVAQWSPAIVHPELDETNRLTDETLPAVRTSIVDSSGRALVELMTVYQIGIDKTMVTPAHQADSAYALATLVEVDAETYQAAVEAAGPQAFVPAITMRQGQAPADIKAIEGARSVEDELPLTTTGYAASLLGTASEATAELIEASNGTLQPGDVVGVSGLQATHDAYLRGQPGHIIRAVPRDPNDQGTPIDLFSVAANNAPPLVLSLNMDLQRRLEDLLAAQGDALMLGVVVDPQTGAILAMANSPAAGSQNFVATGAYPPGSTMKVISSLALIRRGMTADSLVSCTRTATINGREFSNYPGYPEAYLGDIPLRTAVEQSCNTAFMNAYISSEELAGAAASLGIGVDYLTGFDAFYGTVPPTDDPATLAADAIGQGEVVISPVGLAGEAASVAAGHTVVPWLVSGFEPTIKAPPLTEEEASQLRIAMGDVVGPRGTANDMAGILDGAKTGTAEIVVDGRASNVIWLVGFNANYAICLMHYDGTTKWAIHDIARAILA